MIDIKKKEDCCGCSACFSICPYGSIQMRPDDEGFLYPLVNKAKCVQCGACENVCPIQKPVKEHEVPQKAYLVQHKSEDIRLDSTSGGAFTAIAAVVLKKGGVVFGAAYDNEFKVYHICVQVEEDLKKLRNSKYVQSDLNNCFKEVKNFLNDNRWVCFSGTPCQIEGLAKYLGKKYEKLLLVDIVCRGVPSPLIWEKYLEYQHIDEIKPDNIRFRDKFYGYKYSTMSIVRKGENLYHAGSQRDPMLRAFFSDICDRPSCYSCKFKKQYRVSDITIWDCFVVSDFEKKMDDDKGTTRVLCHTAKGVAYVQEIMENARCKEVTVDDAVKGPKEIYSSVEPNSQRECFFRDAQNIDGKSLFDKYFPITLKVRALTGIRKALLVTKLYAITKKCLNRIRRK